MRTKLALVVLLLAALLVPLGAAAQTAGSEESRIATREKLRAVLNDMGPKIGVTFRQSDRQPFNFSAAMTGLANSESLEIVAGVTANETLVFLTYPHYAGGYINVDKVRDTPGLMRQMLKFNHSSFFFWGMDDAGDFFAGYVITLESGFPDEAVRVVLNSIKNVDRMVGQMRPAIDGSGSAGSLKQ